MRLRYSLGVSPVTVRKKLLKLLWSIPPRVRAMVEMDKSEYCSKRLASVMERSFTIAAGVRPTVTRTALESIF